jgi:hypothetical protein
MRIVCGLLIGCAVFAQTPSVGDREAAIEAIRSYARNYTQSLPDYVATQTIRRDVKPVMRGILLPSVRPQSDTIEEEVSYVGHHEMHTTMRVNGRVIAGPQPDESGMFSQGEFGALLDTIFNPANGATLRWDRRATLDKRRVYVIDFRVPDRPAGYSIFEGTRPTVVSFQGSVYADEQLNAVLRIEMTCVGIPSSSAYRKLELAIDYAPTRVAGREFVLPVHYTLNANRVDANLILDGRYKDYRRFATNSTILLDGERP